jgi:hypothetical protein
VHNFLDSFLCSFSLDLIFLFNFCRYFLEVVSAACILVCARVESDSARAVWYELNSKIILFLFSVGKSPIRVGLGLSALRERLYGNGWVEGFLKELGDELRVGVLQQEVWLIELWLN